MEKRKVVGTYQQRREDPLDKIWNEISRPDKTAGKQSSVEAKAEWGLMLLNSFDIHHLVENL